MSKKDLNELKNYFNDIYPHIWERYKFLYDIRTKIDKKFDFLLPFESLLILIFVTLFGGFILDGKFIFLIPLILFLIPLSISFYNIFPRTIYFPWFEKKDIKDIWKIKKEKNFYEQGLREIYGVLRHLSVYEDYKRKLFIKNVLWIYISIFSSISIVMIHFELWTLFLLVILSGILLWEWIAENWGKELVEESPAPEIEEFFNKWKEEEINK